MVQEKVDPNKKTEIRDIHHSAQLYPSGLRPQFETGNTKAAG